MPPIEEQMVRITMTEGDGRWEMGRRNGMSKFGLYKYGTSCIGVLGFQVFFFRGFLGYKTSGNLKLTNCSGCHCLPVMPTKSSKIVLSTTVLIYMVHYFFTIGGSMLSR